jgi:hypothetical protein
MRQPIQASEVLFFGTSRRQAMRLIETFSR